MATLNGTNYGGFSIGTDIGVAISDNYGDNFPVDSLGHMMDFDSAATSSVIKIVPITNGGKPIFQTVWEGGTGKIRFARVNGNLQAMVLELMDAYHSSGIIPVFSIATSILNRDSTIDEYLYTGVQWNTPNFGNYAAMKEVDQNLDFMWSNCVKTGGASAFLTGLAAA